MRFPGQYADVETGTAYNLFRDYDPNVGRYVESDLIGIRGGLSTYAYVNASPVAYVDAMGLWCVPQEWADAISSGVGGFVAGTIASGFDPWAGLFAGAISGVAGYSTSGKGPYSAAMGGGIGGGFGAAFSRGGGGLPGIVGGAVGGALSAGFSATTQQNGAQDVFGNLFGGALGGMAGGLMKQNPGASVFTLTGLGLIGGLAGGVAQDLTNMWLKSHICHCQAQ